MLQCGEDNVALWIFYDARRKWRFLMLTLI